MHKVKILTTSFVTHDVRRFVVDKPKGYKFTPGQATEIAINKKGWEARKHPFTFTSLNEDMILEFTIKGYPTSKYPDHEGMTEMLHKLTPGDELLIDDPWGTINYNEPGVFIAGGAGITPFIAIFRHLARMGKLKGNKLIFSNKTRHDIILEKELRDMFGGDAVFILTDEDAKNSMYLRGRVNKNFLKKHVDDFGEHFYICGPHSMVSDLRELLSEIGARSDNIIFEK